MISATVRLRLKPCLPVEQKEQSSAHPACVEMHSVPRSSSGMNTVLDGIAAADIKQELARTVVETCPKQSPAAERLWQRP
jgi:hypothetical protein